MSGSSTSDGFRADVDGIATGSPARPTACAWTANVCEVVPSHDSSNKRASMPIVGKILSFHIANSCRIRGASISEINVNFKLVIQLKND